MTTGQVFLREFGLAPDGSGRRLIAVVGLIAVSAAEPLQTESQYTVVGPADGTRLTLLPESRIDLREEARGQKAGDLLTSPIWRF